MILRNYHNLLAAFVLGARPSESMTFGDGYLTVNSTAGSTRFLDLSYTKLYTYSLAIGRANNASSNGNTTTYGAPALIFGTGDTAVTYDDYKLDNEYYNLSKSSFVVTEPAYDASNKKFTSTISCLLTNTASSAVTLREIGILVSGSTHTGGGGGVSNFLAYREVLDEPITIAAGDSVKYMHTFEFTMPTIG